MYLEISPRRSGKTTRLIKDVMNFTEDGRQAAIVVQSARMIDYIHKLMREYKPLEWFAHRVSITTNWDNDIRGFEKVYFDEFDFMDRQRVVLNSSWYYTTTPQFLRKLKDVISTEIPNDPLIQLLWMNHMQWVRHPGPPELTYYLDAMSQKAILTEVMGLFIEPEGLTQTDSHARP